MSDLTSPIRKQAADALRRARQLPVGPARNDLRQLAIGLLWLDRKGFEVTVEHGEIAGLMKPQVDHRQER